MLGLLCFWVRSSSFFGLGVVLVFGPCRLHLIDQAGLGRLYFVGQIIFILVRGSSFF